MEKKTIEQPVEMPGEQLRTYLVALTVKRAEINNELYKAKIAADVQKLVDNLNGNAQRK